jgi:hypothetical protein
MQRHSFKYDLQTQFSSISKGRKKRGVAEITLLPPTSAFPTSPPHTAFQQLEMPHFPMNSGFNSSDASGGTHLSIQVKNRRKRYLDLHPEYFSADLELAGPLALP